MNPYLKLTRPVTSFLGTLGVIVGALIAGITSLELIILGAISAFFIAAASNAINDYFDIETDKISKKHRPIASGKVKPKTAFMIAMACFAIGGLISLTFHVYAAVLAFFVIFLSYVYSWKLKSRPLIGNLADSFMAAATFVFGGFLIGYFDLTILVIFLMAFAGNTAREIAKDIEDIKGDKKAGMHTLPILIGDHFSKFIALAFLLIAVFLSLIPYGLEIFGMNYLYAIFVADLVFFASGFVLMTNPAKAQRIMKIGMFFVIAAFLIGIYF